jgi:hypothetical protein
MNWYTVKFLPDNKFVKYVGVWLFILPPILRILYEYKIIEGISFRWTCIFFAALCFTIANIIYIFRCPGIIKDHINFYGFLGDGKINTHLTKYKKQIKNKDIIIPFDNEEKSLKITFGEIQQKALNYRRIALVFCLLFYLFGGFLLSSIIVIETVWVIQISLLDAQQALKSICLLESL